jgi:low affinity Fe/Cu permease
LAGVTPRDRSVGARHLDVGGLLAVREERFLNTNYQLLINTTTTIVTFVMVFIIQSTQNRDGRALQTKLDAILTAIEGDHEDLMGLEDLPEKIIKQVQEEVHSPDAPAKGGG